MRSSTTRPGFLARHDSALLAILTGALMVAAWPFFGAFATSAVAAGAVMGLALRWRHDHQPPDPVDAVRAERMPALNIAAIHVGGDIGGLLFVAGSVAIFMIGMPAFRWFLAASILLATLMALTLVAWRRMR